MNVYSSHVINNSGLEVNTAILPKNRQQVFISSVSDNKDIASLLDKFILLGQQLDALNKKSFSEYEVCKSEKNNLISQVDGLIKDMKSIKDSKFQSMIANSSPQFANLVNTFSLSIKALEDLFDICKEQELYIENKHKDINKIKKELENKYVEMEMLKIKKNTISSVKEMASESKNLKLKDDILLSDSKLIVEQNKNVILNKDISDLRESLQNRDSELEQIITNSKLEKEELNKIMSHIKINSAIQAKQIDELESKIVSYKTKIKELKDQITNSKNLVNSYNSYLSMLPILCGSLVGNAVFSNKYLGTTVGGICGMAYNAYKIDRGNLFFTFVNKVRS